MTDIKDGNYSGMVEVYGTIDLNQFYYRGGLSDADTVKIGLTVESVRFRSNGKSPWKENLEVFGEAYVGGNPVIDSQNRVTVRLQGIDAPELHYHASRGIPEREMTDEQRKKWKNKEFRQWCSAIATWKLATFLNGFEESRGMGIVRAVAYSRVDLPNDVFDIYGRFVGDIKIPMASRKESNVNRWLTVEGWAFPAFYNSMSCDEINTLLSIGKKAKTRKKGVWKMYSDALKPFEDNLYLPGKNEPLVDIFRDNGGVNLPKIFRRQVQYEVNRRSGIYKEPTLRKYLSKTKDYCYRTTDFLNDSKKAKKKSLALFVDPKGTLLVDPWEIIFEEKPTELKDWNNRRIESWY